MPTSVSQRIANPDELAALRKLLADAPSTAARVKRGVANAMVLWAVSLLGVVATWLALGWIVGKAFGIDFGVRSAATLWLLGVAAPLSAILATLSSMRWVRAWPDYRPQLRDDVAHSVVNEERYEFSEAKSFQEPEHGGLIYCLRSKENEVFTVYDGESQTLGVDGKDPAQSRHRPQSNLLVVRAPRSGFVLKRQFSGAPLDAGQPVELAADPKDWPEDESPCPIPWEQLEERLGATAAARPG